MVLLVGLPMDRVESMLFTIDSRSPLPKIIRTSRRRDAVTMRTQTSFNSQMKNLVVRATKAL